jgi:hypothetical protein
VRAIKSFSLQGNHNQGNIISTVLNLGINFDHADLDNANSDENGNTAANLQMIHHLTTRLCTINNFDEA